jgi:Tol biopolymer transport system component
MKPTIAKILPNRHGFLHSLLISIGALVLLLLLNACNGGLAAAPTRTPTTIPTNAPLHPPTVTPSPTSVPLDGRGGGVIVFASWERNDWQLYRMNADGSGKKKITVDVKGGYEPAWSPDGTKIVFQYSGLWIADIISGEIAPIPFSVAENNLPNEYLVKPSWSPTGEWIAFLNESGYQGDIYLIRPDGTSLTRLTSTDDISRDGNLVWSPDGTQIAYSADRDGNIEIYLLNVENAIQGNAASQQLTNTSTSVRNLVTSWSPDGAWLAFSSDRDGNTEIYLMDPDGGNVVRLTNHPFSDFEPDFSPDGSQIAFSSNRDGDIEIYVLNVEEAIRDAATATVTRLTNHKGDEAGPVWGPVP